VGWFDDSSSAQCAVRGRAGSAGVAVGCVVRPTCCEGRLFTCERSSEQGGQAGVFLVAAASRCKPRSTKAPFEWQPFAVGHDDLVVALDEIHSRLVDVLARAWEPNQ